MKWTRKHPTKEGIYAHLDTLETNPVRESAKYQPYKAKLLHVYFMIEKPKQEFLLAWMGLGKGNLPVESIGGWWCSNPLPLLPKVKKG